MSVEAMTWAFNVPLPPCPKSVLVALANRADEDGYCWPGIDDLERRTGWKRRAIQLAIRQLVADQLVTVSPRYLPSMQQNSNLYRLEIGRTPPTISCGEGASHAPRGVHQVHGGGAPDAPLGVHHMHGEGAPHAPKSSSEQSDEQSSEQSGVAKATRHNGLVGLENFAMTPELEAWAVKEQIENPGQYVEEFKDHWRTVEGKRKTGQVVKDWPAAFRNRLRQLRDWGRLKAPSDSLEDRLKKWAAEEVSV